MSRIRCGSLGGPLMLAAIAALAACSPVEPSVSETEIWKIVLQQERGGKEGRIYFFLRLNRSTTTDPNCGTPTTAFLATVEAIPMRVQNSGTGNAVGSWNGHGVGSCFGFSATITLRGETFELTANGIPPFQRDLLLREQNPTWSTGVAGRGGTFLMTQEENTGYNPDSHLDILILNQDGDDRGFSIWPRPTDFPGDGSSFQVNSGTSRLWTVPRTDSILIRAPDVRARAAYDLNARAVSSGPFPSGTILTVTCALDAASAWEVQLVVTAEEQLRCGLGWREAVSSFAVSVAPSAVSIMQGAEGRMDVSVTPNDRSGSDVALSLAAVPAGVSGRFGASTISGNRGGTTTLDLAVAPDAVPGTYRLLVEGTRDGEVRSAGLTLTIPVVPTPQGCAGSSGTFHAIAITASETWTVAAGPHRVNGTLPVTNNAVLAIQPAVLVCMGPQAMLSFSGGARLLAEGTATDPIRFLPRDPASPWDALDLGGTLSGHSSLFHVLIDRSTSGIRAGSQHEVQIENTRIRQTSLTALTLAAPGSEFYLSTIDTTLAAQVPAVSLGGGFGTTPILFEGTVRAAAGEGVRIGNGSQTIWFRACEILGSGSHGLTVPVGVSGGVSVQGCNLVGNTGLGVSNSGSFVLDARGNWWGDPAGPAGPAGDGVSGAVDVSNFLTVPAPIGPRPQFSMRR